MIIDRLSQNARSGQARRLVAWIIALAVITLLGAVRTATAAEYAFASLVVLPVVFLAWNAGFGHGALAALLGAAMWTITGMTAGREYSSGWIPVANGVTRFATYTLLAYLTATVRTLLARQAERAATDPLTGLLNHRTFFDLGVDEVRRSTRYGHHLAVAFIDLDDFKRLNDARGHEAGDEALRAVAGALLRGTRATDRVARLGGDEFAVLLPELGREAASIAAQRMHGAVSDALAGHAPATASLGMAWFEEPTAGFPELLRTADRLMYEAKQSGKGRSVTREFPRSPEPPSRDR